MKTQVEFRSKPFIRKLFKKIDTTAEVSRVSEALKKVLESNPDIRDINWISEKDR